MVVALSTLFGVASAIGTSAQLAVFLPLVAVAVVESAALWFRRTHPTTVLLVCVALTTVGFAVTRDRDPSTAALAFALYAVSAYAVPRVRLGALVAAFLVVVAGVALLAGGEFELARKVMPLGATTLIAWVAGDFMRSRREAQAETLRRLDAARREAGEQERLRIARELHDVVAHNVSVMAIQAGAARVAGNSSHEALSSIESTARDTLSELNRLVGVLRRGPAAQDLSPQPRLGDIESLIQPVRDAGVDVTLTVDGERRDLPAALDLSAYRIVQEALTNVLKHANATRVEVTIGYASDAVTLTISDNGSGAEAVVGASTGHGLIGMRERVDVFGGQLTTGSSPRGGFSVRARLPIR